MNMISTGAFLNEMDASNKQPSTAEKFAAVWESKNAKAARAGGVSLMALSLAACGSSSSTTTTTTTTTTDTTTTTTATSSALTVATDTVTGTAGNDSVTAARIDDVQTLNSSDNIDLGAGTADSLTANLNAGTVSPTMAGVESVTFTAVGSAASTVDFVNTTGVTSITNSGSTKGLTVDNVAALAPITISNTAQATTVVFKTAAASGSDDSVTLNLQDVSGGIITIGSEADGDGAIENITINATGTNVTGDIAFGTTATAITVTGTGSLDINAGAEFALVETITASGLTGDFDVKLANRAADSTTKDLTITSGGGDDDLDLSALADAKVDNITIDAGAGDDRVALDGNTDTGNSIDGGAGTDILSLDVAMTATTAAYVSNFETLEFRMGADVTQDMDLADGMNTVNVNTSGAAGNDLNIDDAADGLTINLNGAALAGIATGNNKDITELTVDLKTDTANDDLTVNLNAAAGGVSVADFLPNANYETVTVTSSGTAQNTIIDISTSLRNMTFTGETALKVTGTGALLGVADASAMTGALTLTTGTVDLKVLGGAGDDSLTSGAIAASGAQTLDGGAGDDTLTAGQIVTSSTLTLKGGAGSDTITTAALDGNTTGTKTAVAVIDGGAGVDFITLDTVATVAINDVQSTVALTADADVVDDFTTGEDDFDYNGTLKNDAATTVVVGTNTTLATALSADVDATVFVDSGNLTGAASTTLTTLADTTDAEAFATAAAAFEAALVALEGTVTGLDSTIEGTETVLLVFDNNADTVVLKFTNSDVSVANTMTVDELEVVAVFDAEVLAAANDFI